MLNVWCSSGLSGNVLGMWNKPLCLDTKYGHAAVLFVNCLVTSGFNMIDTEQLRDFIKQVIREEVTVYIEVKQETEWTSGKVQVSLSMDNKEFAFYEDYM